MRRILLLLFILLLSLSSSIRCRAQVSTSQMIGAKAFSKETTLYRAKEFIITNVLSGRTELTRFTVDALAASSSGELTTLVYNCLQEGKEGLVFGFYGDAATGLGVSYPSYAFKNLAKDSAMALLTKIGNVIKEQKAYLSEDRFNHNVFFSFGDMKFLLYRSDVVTIIRVFWNGFDADWQSSAFAATKQRFEKKVD